MPSSSLPPIVQALIDRQAILDCIHAYARGVDRCDRDLLNSVYHEDAWDDHAVFCGPAADFIEWAFAYHEKYLISHQHYVLNHTCELRGAVAHTETYFIFAGRNREGPPVTLLGGRYLDRFEKRAERWAIAARKCLVEWNGSLNDIKHHPDWLAALHSSGRSARSPEDTSYERPLQVTRPAHTVAPY